MAEKILRDTYARPIGSIQVDSRGVQTLRDVRGRVKGIYDPQRDVTMEPNGRIYGWGNLLMMLLND